MILPPEGGRCKSHKFVHYFFFFKQERRWTVEQPHGVFAVVAADLAELVENASSQGFGNFSVAGIDCFEVITFGLPTHENVTRLGC